MTDFAIYGVKQRFAWSWVGPINTLPSFSRSSMEKGHLCARYGAARPGLGASPPIKLLARHLQNLKSKDRSQVIDGARAWL
jgi:hypothetical protein